MHVVGLGRAGLLEERVVEHVFGPRQVAEQEAAPAADDVAGEARRQPVREPAQARVDPLRKVLRELRDRLGAEQRRRDAVLAARARQSEHAFRVVVPLWMIRWCRLNQRAPVDDQVLVARRTHADDVGIERQVEVRPDPVGNRQLDKLLHVPPGHRRADEPKLRAHSCGGPEIADLRNDVRVAEHDVAPVRDLRTYSRCVRVRNHDVAGAEWLEEGVK